MTTEGDGVEEVFDGQARVLLTAAGRAGETFARMREEVLRGAQATSEQQARELASRFEAERQTARAEYGNVYRNEWWDTATPDQIGHTYQTATAWQQEDREAARAVQDMRDQFQSRYGVDGAQLDPAAVQTAIARADRDRADAEAQRRQASAEEAEAIRLFSEADRADNAAEAARADARQVNDPEDRADAFARTESHQAHADATRTEGQSQYDSAERRAATAHQLETQGVSRQAIDARMRADVSQSQPATEAVKGNHANAPRARRSRGNAPQAQRTAQGR